ncbi:MAG TPA: SRPBCC domain-containing protein [Gemmatimonadales bacterium]|nr:SRPBCC domain-containing protein [Gemmatimonadales bacterium]
METIHIQSFVSAPRTAVWEQLMGRPDIVLDALPVQAWPDQREEQAPSRLLVRWPFSSGGTATTSVAITLAEVSGGTRIDLKHEGWHEEPGWQDAIAGHFAGWLQALAALGLLVETGTDPRAASAVLAGKERYFASAEIPAGADAVFRSLADPDVRTRWSDGALDGAELVESVESRFLRFTLPGKAGPGELAIILRRTPRGTHCALAEYGVVDRSASARWPKLLERLTRFLR